MRRRNSTNPRRLDSRKSAASVTSVQLNHISLETAERHAQVAATQAFVRAKERSTTDSNSPSWPPPRTAGPGSNVATYPYSTMTPFEEAQLQRQQSIRFVRSGPAPLPTGNMVTKKAPPSRTSRMLNQQSGDVVEADTRPPSSASTSGMVYAAKGTAGDYIDTLFKKDEFYTPMDGVASMPSSYRRIRKSRSMFNAGANAEHPGLRDNSSFANSFPIRSNAESAPLSQGLKASKSASLLRDLKGTFAPVFRSDNNAARSSSTAGHHQDTRATIRLKTSKFFGPRVSNHDRVFRKSMRDTGDIDASMNEKRLNDGSLRLKARKVSQGVKYRLKSLFGLSKGDEDHGLFSDMLLPEQHINSEQSYPFDFDDQLHETDDELRRVPSIEQAAISHVPSGIPSLHANTVYEQLRSQQGSIESFQNEQKASDEGSRVTSWCNSDSSAANSLNSCRYEEAGKKRLSIINENGAHICSSSIGLQQNSDQSNGSTTSLNRQVVPQETRAAFNGQRIYSALMKRMNEAKQTGSVEMESEDVVESTVQLGAVPRQNSSRRHRQLTGDSAATIRYVLSDSDSDSASSQTGRKLPGGDGGDLQPTAAKQKTMHYAAQELAYAHRTGDVPTKGTDNNSPATPQTEHRLAVNSTLSSSRSSAFFGSPTRYLFRTQSPYRRALQDQMRTETKEKPMASTGFNPWMQSLSNIPNLPMPSSTTYGSDADRKLHYAESVYSTNEEDASAKKYTVSSADNGLQNPKITHGDAIIFVNETDYEKRSSSVTHKPRVPSSSSSAEWKTWLSSNVSKLGEKAFSLNPSNIQTGLDSARSSRHIRENAQINDDGESQTFSLNESSPAHPAVHHGKHKIAHWNCSDDDDNEGADQDLAVPFDAGLSHSVLQRRLPFANLVHQGSSGPSVAFADTPARVVHPKTSAESFDANREGALADVPPSTFKENASNGRTNVTTKLMKRQPKLRASMANLIRRTSSGGHSGKADKASYAQHRVTGVLSAKAENVSPAVVQDGDGDDPYRIEGGGVLGPNQNEDVGSRRMVDIFLSSRRRRMASTDDESVFL